MGESPCIKHWTRSWRYSIKQTDLVPALIHSQSNGPSYLFSTALRVSLLKHIFDHFTLLNTHHWLTNEFYRKNKKAKSPSSQENFQDLTPACNFGHIKVLIDPLNSRCIKWCTLHLHKYGMISWNVTPSNKLQPLAAWLSQLTQITPSYNLAQW